MIRLKGAKFRNYRGLRKVDIEFAHDGTPALTVIRAENATGKTSMLYGLTWCLFGESGLPVTSRRRSNYRLSPIDWDTDKNGPEVTVQVIMKVTVGVGREAVDYEITRTASETVTNEGFTFTPSSVEVLKFTPRGAVLLTAPEVFLSVDFLPVALKDIFFIDGDEALKDYVESGQDDTRKNVREAVRNLLGLEVLEMAQGHLDDVRRSITSDISRKSSGELQQVTTDLSAVETRISDLKTEIADLQDNLKGATEARQNAKQARDAVISGGGFQLNKLQHSEAAARRAGQSAAAEAKTCLSQQRELLSTRDLLTTIARKQVQEAVVQYESLASQNKLPNTVPEVMQERLFRGICICGASLAPGTDGHRFLTKELEEAERFDVAHNLLTAIWGQANQALAAAAPSARNWFTQSNGNLTAWLHAIREAEERQAELSNLEVQIERAAHGGDYETVNNRYNKAELFVTEARTALSRKEIEFEQAKKIKVDLAKREIEVGRRETRFRKRQAEQQAAKDMLSVINGTVAVLQNEKIQEVGSRTNEIFQALVAAAPEEVGRGLDTVVQEITLTEACEIKVWGPHKRSIDTANGLSGAQRRALTVAFILALTQVSGMSAPLVIDTPLGMTSGVIRRALLENTLINSSQAILFLTRDEILGVEDILDKYTGTFFTLTNTQHRAHRASLPDGQSGVAEVLICSCDYKSSCPTCAQKEA
jgi:DNA sulfur modification protein DndD